MITNHSNDDSANCIISAKTFLHTGRELKLKEVTSHDKKQTGDQTGGSSQIQGHCALLQQKLSTAASSGDILPLQLFRAVRTV